MPVVTIDTDELRQLIKESVKEAMEEQIERFEDSVIETIEDYELGEKMKDIDEEGVISLNEARMKIGI